MTLRTRLAVLASLLLLAVGIGAGAQASASPAVPASTTSGCFVVPSLDVSICIPRL